MGTLRRHRLDERQRLVDRRRQYGACGGVDADLAATVASDLRWDLHALLQLRTRLPAAPGRPDVRTADEAHSL